VNNKAVQNADYCLECDDYDDGRTCENDHPKQLVHRWEVTENYFRFGPQDSNIWISQGFNDKKPRAWFAEGSFQEEGARELTKKELSSLSETFTEMSRIIE
jgi:hypothetical protein